MGNNQIPNNDRSQPTTPFISQENTEKIQKNWKTRTITLIGAGAVAVGSIGLVIPAVAVVGLWWLGAAYKTSKQTSNKLTGKTNQKSLKQEIYTSKTSKPLNVFFETIKIAISPKKTEIVNPKVIIFNEKKCIREFFSDLIVIFHNKKDNFTPQNFLNTLDKSMKINLRTLSILSYKEKDYKLEFTTLTIGESTYNLTNKEDRLKLLKLNSENYTNNNLNLEITDIDSESNQFSISKPDDNHLNIDIKDVRKKYIQEPGQPDLLKEEIQDNINYAKILTLKEKESAQLRMSEILT